MTFLYRKLDPEAKDLMRARESDSGFDLTAIKVTKRIDNVLYCDTGISVQPPPGYYTEVVARSSLHKFGYMLVNSVGIIDEDYRGPIILALFKFDPEVPDIELPLRVAQLIPRKRVKAQFQEVSELSETERGDGGFGSTGK